VTKNRTPRVAVLRGEGLEKERASALADRLGLPIVSSRETGAGFHLVFSEGRLEIRPADPRSWGAVYVDFTGGGVARRGRAATRRNEKIARAVGLGGRSVTVVDATAGLGRDAFVLASLGATVTAVERSVVVAALLEDGLIRAARQPDLGTIIPARFRLVVEDARTVLGSLGMAQLPDVVYLDPMFPVRKKSALVKKEMQLFQALIGEEEDTEDLFEAACRTAKDRVVVKRPVHAPPLVSQPGMTYRGKTVRWDVYPVGS